MSLFAPQTFVVQNITSPPVVITVFGVSVPPNNSFNVMQIPNTTIADVEASLMSGELYDLIVAQSIIVTATNIGLILFASGITCGVATLVNGVSPVISANLTSSSTIVMSYQDISGSTALGVLVAPLSDRVDGTPGSFVIRSFSLLGAPVVGDQSIVNWQIV